MHFIHFRREFLSPKFPKAIFITNNRPARYFSVCRPERLSEKPRVHVLGLGSIGVFTAHSLSEIPCKPSVALLLHRASLLDGYKKKGRHILLETKEGALVGSGGYDLELYREGEWYSIPSSSSLSSSDGQLVNNTTVDNLIVSVKATQTVSALRPLRNRLSANSTILFLQIGCGMIDEVNDILFPDPQTRPNYIVGVISHGVALNNPFHVTHTGLSSLSLGQVPRADVSPTPKITSPNYLLDNLPLSPRLNATTYAYTDVLQIQLEKLAVNAFCNPICALNDAKTSFTFTVPDTRRAIVTEFSNVVLSLPELEDVPGVRERFSIDRLEATVTEILSRNADTTCSMVWNLRAGRETEVRFINGYWVRRGKEVGVETPVNECLMKEVMKRSGQSF